MNVLRSFKPKERGRLICDECFKMQELIVELGRPMAHEGEGVHVCEQCLRKALRLLGKEK